MQRPLEGIRVLSVTQALFGPYCGMLLADLGAEVIKIEKPGTGDMNREWGPFFPGVEGPDKSGYYVSIHRNHKSITLNLKTKKGQEILKELVKISDVLIENFRPGTLDSWGIGYEELKKVNPRLIYACGSGFGHSGPYRDWSSYDIIGQAMSGFMDLNGWPDKPPCRAGSSIGDIIAGMFLCIGILAALRYRDITGKGQKVDVAQMDSMLAVLENAVIRYTLEGKPPTRIGAKHPTITPFDIFKAKDGYVVIAAGNDAIWRRLCNVMGKPELADDPRFATNPLRCKHESELKPIIEEWTKDKTRWEIVNLLLANDVPSAPVYNVAEAVEDPQTKAREMIVEVDQPQYGKVRIVGCPIKFSETPIRVFKPAPLLGQHTEEVLTQLLGYSKEQIEALRKENVI
ncbi:MAG: CoA transferase [Candidatus Methanomethylicaceae archaeon]